MSTYRPVLDNDPSPESLIALFNRTSPDDWVHDEEANRFSLKAKPVLSVESNAHGGFSLVYGFDEVTPLSAKQVKHVQRELV